MSLPTIVIYQLNDQYVEIDGLADALNPTSYISNATVTASLIDPSGNAVFTNITLTYVATSNGVYRGSVVAGTFPSTLVLGGGYILKVDGTTGAGVFHLERKAKMAIRNS